MTHPLAWQDDANCATTDPDVMFPEGPSGKGIKICGGCARATRDACLLYAVENSIEYGIFGGKTAKEREGLRVRVVRA
jgi:WhiB family redox-sensing transcriptional regulator